MSQQLTLEISDEVYADLQRKANAVGISITEWIVTVLNRQGAVASKVVSKLIYELSKSHYDRTQ